MRKDPDENLNQTKDYYKDRSKTTLYPLKTKISTFAENKVFHT